MLAVVLGLVGSLFVPVLVDRTAAPAGAQSPEVVVPLWCTGSSSINGGVSPRYGLAWVPAGATVSFQATDIEILPSSYGGAGRGEYQYYARILDGDSEQELWERWHHAGVGTIHHGGPYEWVWVGERIIPRSWTNNTGVSQPFLIEMRAVRGFAGAGTRWNLQVNVAGGNGDPAPVCDVNLFSESEMFGPNGAMRYQCPCQATAADPVDTRSGNLHMPLPGIAVAGRGPGLSFSLGYNSLDLDSAGAVGRGWSTTLDMALQENPDGSRTVVQEQGATVRFVPADGGGWEAPARMSATLTEHGDGSFTFERNHVERFTFDGEGRLAAMADRFGNETVVAYPSGSSRQASYLEDPAGRRLTFTWSGDRLVSVVDGLPTAEGGPRSLGFAYDGEDLVEYTDVADGVWTIGYEDHRMVSFRKPRHVGDPTAAVVNAYDGQGRVLWQDDEDGNRTSFAYDTPAVGQTTITLPEGRVRVDRFEDHRRVETVSAAGTPQEASVTFAYDPASWGVTTVTDERGQEWHYDYDEVGNRTYAEDPLGRISRWDHNDLEQVVEASAGEVRTGPSTTDTSELVVSVWDYDGDGRLLSSTMAQGSSVAATTAFAYDPVHPTDVVAVTDPRGKVWTFDHDPATGVQVAGTDPLGNTTTWEHNAVGWVTSTVTPRGNETGATPGEFTTTYVHDRRGLVTEVTNPTGDVTRFAFDANGNLVATETGLSATDPDPDVTTYAYDVVDRLVARDEPGPGSVSYEYRDDGLRSAFVDEDGGRYEYGYDARGRLAVEVDPTGATTAYGYDAGSNLTSVTQPGLATCEGPILVGCVTYGYDAAGQLVTVGYSDPATPDVVDIGYDALGRRTEATAAGVTEMWAWDPVGRLVAHEDANGRTTSYGWDVASNLTSIGYPGQVDPVVRSFDDAGRLVSVTDWLGNTTGFDYDANGNWTDTTFPVASTNADTYGYDAADRLVSIEWWQGATSLGSFDYDPRDNKGQVTQADTAGAAGDPMTWGYDERDRLVTENAATFGYDPVGNLVERPDGTLQVFDPAQRLCWTSPTATGGDCTTAAPSDATIYDYDARGNRVAERPADGVARTLTYDQADRLVGVVDEPVAAISSMDGFAIPGDFDGDSRDDVFFYKPGGGAANRDFVVWGADRADFGAAADEYPVSGTYVPVAGDFNGDGVDDIFWYGPGTAADSVWFWFGRHGGGYDSKAFTVNGVYQPLVGDFNGDGYSDIYWYGVGTVSDILWYGHATVDEPATVFGFGPASNDGTYQAVVGDFDGNGADDIFWYGPGSAPDEVWFSWPGSQNEWIKRSVTVSGADFQLVAGDFDGDGRDDLLFYSPSGSDVVWWGNDASSFGPGSQKWLTISGATQPVAGDFDGDGSDDLFLYAAGPGADTMWWGTSRAGFGTDGAHIGLTAQTEMEASYRYGVDGLRAAKTVDATTTEFTWSAGGGLPLLLGEHVETSAGVDETWLVHGPGGRPIAQIDPDEEVLWLHQDQIGSIRAATDEAGDLVSQRSWDAYGNPAAATGSDHPILGYTGEYTDTETGYTYLRARYYDPTTAQFLTVDPLLTTTEDPYGYASTNPTNYTDPWGLCSFRGIRIGALSNDDGGCRGAGVVEDVKETAEDVINDAPGAAARTFNRTVGRALNADLGPTDWGTIGASLVNVGYGAHNTWSGYVLITAAEYSGRLPYINRYSPAARALGAWKLSTGSARTYRGLRQAAGIESLEDCDDTTLLGNVIRLFRGVTPSDPRKFGWVEFIGGLI